MTRTPPAMASSRKRQPCNSPATVQPPGTACQGRPAIQGSMSPTPTKARSAARASASVTPAYSGPSQLLCCEPQSKPPVGGAVAGGDGNAGRGYSLDLNDVERWATEPV
jgi:hypothetical protein